MILDLHTLHHFLRNPFQTLLGWRLKYSKKPRGRLEENLNERQQQIQNIYAFSQKKHRTSATKLNEIARNSCKTQFVLGLLEFADWYW